MAQLNVKIISFESILLLRDIYSKKHDAISKKYKMTAKVCLQLAQLGVWIKSLIVESIILLHGIYSKKCDAI